MKEVYVVKYVSRDIGFGVNEYEHEFYDTKKEAKARVEELRANDYYGISVTENSW